MRGRQIVVRAVGTYTGQYKPAQYISPSLQPCLSFARTNPTEPVHHEYTNTRIHEYTNTRIHEYTNTRIHEYTNTQIPVLLSSRSPLYFPHVFPTRTCTVLVPRWKRSNRAGTTVARHTRCLLLLCSWAKPLGVNCLTVRHDPAPDLTRRLGSSSRRISCTAPFRRATTPLRHTPRTSDPYTPARKSSTCRWAGHRRTRWT